MTIMRKADKAYIVICNVCSAVLQTGEYEHKTAVEHLKRERWRYHNKTPSGEFKHFCPPCKKAQSAKR